MTGDFSIYEMSVGSLRDMLPLVRVWGRVSVVDKARTQAENMAKILIGPNRNSQVTTQQSS